MMSKSLIDKIIDNLKEFSPKVKLLRVCGTGEPLLNKDTIHLVKRAKMENCVEKIELITNGLLLNEIYMEALPQYIDRIIVSIEGLNENDYVKFTGSKIDFSGLVNKLKKLYQSKQEMHSQSTILLKLHNSALGDNQGYDRFLDIFQGAADKFTSEYIVDMWPELSVGKSNNSFRFPGTYSVQNNVNVCPQIFKTLQVCADGEVLPCCFDYKRVNLLGNISNQNESLLSIWHGDKLRKLQLEHLNLNKCNLPVCGSCTANNMTDIDNIDDQREEILRRFEQ
jgi:radical SAM protein with 4Fe4S-binding SPASM domain